MLIKTRELTGTALDWAVAIADNRNPVLTSGIQVDGLPAIFVYGDENFWRPSIDWGQAGPLIDKYSIQVYSPINGSDARAYSVREVITEFSDVMSGKTTLGAICRAVVYQCIGEAVEIPVELIEQP